MVRARTERPPGTGFPAKISMQRPLLLVFSLVAAPMTVHLGRLAPMRGSIDRMPHVSWFASKRSALLATKPSAWSCLRTKRCSTIDKSWIPITLR
jgi:hypothetical protein